LNQIDNAIHCFSELSQRPNGIIHDQVLWYLGLAYLKIGNHEKAAQAFFPLKSEGNVYSLQVTEILELIQ
jgi:hypothetical protein